MTRPMLPLLALVLGMAACQRSADQDAAGAETTAAQPSQTELVADGRQVFRFDTFGNDHFWTDTLGLHEAIGQSVDPTTALSVGLKVDAEVLPPGLLEQADLTSPATTVALLKLNAIVGVVAEVDEGNRITRLGITCALCHSTVDNSVSAGIGRRQDGWPNRDLNVGAIIALSPRLPAAARAVYAAWGPGRYDPRYNIDGKNTPLVLPPAYGLASVTNETYTAEGPISYWNAYVAVTQMHGRGAFADPRLGIEVQHAPDLVTPKLPALRAYQHSLATPAPPAGSFDSAGAARGRLVFDQRCATCHVGGTGTDNNSGVLHAASETGMDGAYAERTATKQYRTTPLRALWQHPPYFHDGSASTLTAVVAHYNRVLRLNLTAAERADLVEYLRSI
jgi:mono/diheme cytochrome c family protein